MMKFIYKLLGYRKTTLADMDEKKLEEVFREGLNMSLSEIDKYSEKENNCDKCGFRLIVVHPHKWMDSMILCECENCKERFYRKPLIDRRYDE